MAKRFVKQTIKVTVLSEDKIPEWNNLNDLDYLITEGDCVGNVEVCSSEIISKEETKDLLYKFGSDPEFFGLGDENNE